MSEPRLPNESRAYRDARDAFKQYRVPIRARRRIGADGDPANLMYFE